MNWQYRETQLTDKTIRTWWARRDDLIMTVDSTREGQYFVQVRNSHTHSSVTDSRPSLEEAQSTAVKIAAYPEMQTPQ